MPRTWGARTADERQAERRDRLVRAALRVYVERIRRDPATSRVFLIEMANVSPAAEALAAASLDRFGALLIEVLGDDPGFEVSPSPLLLRGIVGGGLHIIQAWATSGYAEEIGIVADLNLRLYRVLARPGT